MTYPFISRIARRSLLAITLFVPFLGHGAILHAQDASSPYLGQIMLVAFDFAPQGWAECNGQLLPINQNQALFSLLGTTYGGNGTTTFALPDLRGRVPVQAGSPSSITLGQTGGEENHTLLVSEMPAHSHAFAVSSSSATAVSPAAAVPARTGDLSRMYGKTPDAAMNASAVTNTGGAQPHQNRMPYIALRYIIALQGVYPPQN